MKLLHETPDEYIRFCRQAVAGQQVFIQALEAKLEQNKDDPEWEETNKLLTTSIEEQRIILGKLQQRLDRARRGQYEQ